MSLFLGSMSIYRKVSLASVWGLLQGNDMLTLAERNVLPHVLWQELKGLAGVLTRPLLTILI